MRRIEKIKKLSRDAGSHWFDKKTMEFFHTVLYPNEVYKEEKTGDYIFIIQQRVDMFRSLPPNPVHYEVMRFNVQTPAFMNNAFPLPESDESGFSNQHFKTLEEARKAVLKMPGVTK
jgi:hypothetical protein